METDYNKILDFMLTSGKRLAERTGNIEDIGITKADLTEEDIAIERGLDEIIKTFDGKHLLYAEEENDIPRDSEHVWVVDPISGTSNFIKGTGRYAIAVTHVVKGVSVFAAVYDPTADELYTAFLGKGAYMNNRKVSVNTSLQNILFRVSAGWKDQQCATDIEDALSAFVITQNSDSMALNYCWVASGEAGGIVVLNKDSFPDFAGGFILQEAGGVCTNIEGKSHFSIKDRVFVGGSRSMYDGIVPIVQHYF